MKRILIATDFTPTSRHMTDLVLAHLNLSQDPCHLLLLNTYMVLAPDPGDAIFLNDGLKSNSLKGLEIEKDRITPMVTKNVTMETLSHMGTQKNVIASIVKRDAVDLVVTNHTPLRDILEFFEK